MPPRAQAFAAYLATNRCRIALLMAAPPVFALLVMLSGKEAGWDLQNYHWYNPYAWLNQRLGLDVAVAHHATYYNPLIDLPFYWIATHAPAWLAGVYLGALFGVVVTLLGAIVYQAIAGTNIAWRTTIALLIAIAGASGGGALSALGNTSNDVPVAIGIFAALWLLLWRFAQLQSAQLTMQLAMTVLFAGVCAGVSVGLKLTMAIYALGLLVATFMTPSTWHKRSSCTVLLGIGMLFGYIASAGFWLWRMWQYGRNPLFPYFNHWFHSPLLVDGSYRDTTYVDAHDWLDKLLLPWRFTLDSRQVSEWVFRDPRILLAYVLIPVSLLVMKMGKRSQPAATSQQAMSFFLFCFAASTYLAWVSVFGIYRYLIPLEMLAPLLITLAVLLWPATLRLRITIIVITLLAGQTIVKTDMQRTHWDDAYVQVQPPSLIDPHSMILMTGTWPMAFVIPSFPASIPFLRIDGWMVGKDDNSSGLARQLRNRVAHHEGPLLMLYGPLEQANADAAVQAYGLRRFPESCVKIPSNIADPLQLCSVERIDTVDFAYDVGTRDGNTK